MELNWCKLAPSDRPALKVGALKSCWKMLKLAGVWHFAESSFVSFCPNLLCSSLKKKALLYYYAVMADLCVLLAGLHLKYRSLVPEFLWPGPGSLRHFVLLTLAAAVFLTSSSSSSSTSLTVHQLVHSNTKHTHTHTHTHRDTQTNTQTDT